MPAALLALHAASPAPLSRAVRKRRRRRAARPLRHPVRAVPARGSRCTRSRLIGRRREPRHSCRRSIAGGSASACRRRIDAAGSVPFTGGWLVYLGYELAGQIEPRLRLPPPSAGPIAQAIRIPAAVIHEHDSGRCWIVAEADCSRSDSSASRTICDASHACRDARRRRWSASSVAEEDPRAVSAGGASVRSSTSRAGDIYQANLSRGWRATLRPRRAAAPSLSAIARDQSRAVQRRRAARRHRRREFSPERLVSVRDGCGRDASDRRHATARRGSGSGSRARARAARASEGARRARHADRPGAQRSRPRVRGGHACRSMSS